MNPTTFSLVLAGALAALAPVLSGCAEDDYDREAAYPQVVGTTAPRPSPEVAVAPATTPSVQPVEQPAADESQPADQSVDTDDYADTDPSALTDFRSTLDPYGTWHDDGTYGTVWTPSESVVGDDFSPYVSAGHWAYDDDDYTWVSDYDWGWAPFHYGRWVYAPPYGWEWVPGRVYAGAWVSWRYGWGDWGYVGWAPLGPTWGWWGGRAVGLGFVPVAPYGFCASGDLFAGSVGPHMVAGGQVSTIAAHTQPWVPARPTVNGRVAASPRVNGPPPQVLHIPQSAVVRNAGMNRGVDQARAFAHASTATPMGARAPQAFASRAPTASRLPSYGSPATSHFGGRLGSGFRGDVASARPTYGPSYTSRPGWGGSTYSGSRSGWSGYSGSRSGWTYGGSSYRGGWSGGGSSFRPTPGVAPTVSSTHRGGGSSGDGGYSGVQHGFSGGGYHGGGFSGGSFGGGGTHFGGGGGGGAHFGGGGGGGHGGGHR